MPCPIHPSSIDATHDSQAAPNSRRPHVLTYPPSRYLEPSIPFCLICQPNLSPLQISTYSTPLPAPKCRLLTPEPTLPSSFNIPSLPYLPLPGASTTICATLIPPAPSYPYPILLAANSRPSPLATAQPPDWAPYEDSMRPQISYATVRP
jgi:hypothetical protein